MILYGAPPDLALSSDKNSLGSALTVKAIKICLEMHA